MLYNIILVIHVIVVIVLVATILIQRGRSGGLVEALGGVESLFGTKTSAFLVKLTVILAITFFVSSFSLAYLSKRKYSSLMEKLPPQIDASEETNDTSPVSTDSSLSDEVVPIAGNTTESVSEEAGDVEVPSEIPMEKQ